MVGLTQSTENLKRKDSDALRRKKFCFQTVFRLKTLTYCWNCQATPSIWDLFGPTKV